MEISLFQTKIEMRMILIIVPQAVKATTIHSSLTQIFNATIVTNYLVCVFVALIISVCVII